MAEWLVLVPGVPRSKSSRSYQTYQAEVNREAHSRFPTPLSSHRLSVEVHHFYRSAQPPDLDNMLKTVLDGLKGAAYRDDSQVRRVCAERYNISGGYELDNPLPDWLEHLTRGEEFVSITVSGAEGD